MGGLDPMASHDTHKMAHRVEGTQVAMNADGTKVALGLGASPTEEGEQPLMVNVNGIQYAWIFTYPDTGAVSGELNVPVGRTVQLNISAGDVLHAFWLPELRIKQDAIPGRNVQLTFTATRIGDYPVICAELCGAYHGGMKSVLHVQSQEDFDKWMQSNTIAKTEALDDTVAINPSNLSDGEFLAPYAQEMGIDAKTLDQLHAHHEMASHQ
jgi:cytochrome c oxidase subunit II